MKRSSFILILILSVLLSMPAFQAGAKEEYIISYDYGIADMRPEGIINNNPDSYTKGQSLQLSAPSCQGFDFKGWYLDSGMTYPVAAIDSTYKGNITLFAKWYESEYSVNYVLTTPSVLTDSSIVSHENSTTRKTTESITLFNPQCISDIYTFEGWYSDASYKNKITEIPEWTCSDVTVYAKWVYSEFNIFYDMGEAEKSPYAINNPNPHKYTAGTELILAAPVINDTAYTFDGWYTDSYLSRKITSIPADASGDIVIYAGWSVTSCKVNYVLTDSSGISAADITNTNPLQRKGYEALVLSEPVTHDKNYQFDGWYSDKELTQQITQINSGTYNDVTVYAKWKKALYTIDYSYGVISTVYLKINNPNPDEYSYGDCITLQPVEAEGFIFNGWCSDEALKNRIEEISPDAYGDMTIYADFTEKTYSITYVLEGNGVKASQVMNENKTKLRTTTKQLTLLDATALNSDKKFGGWYLDKEYTEKIEYIRAYSTGNITLYAKWVSEKEEEGENNNPSLTPDYIPVWGDATLSDGLSASDARLVLRYSAKLEKDFSELQLRISDINNDSVVNSADARLILRLSARLENINNLEYTYSLPDIAVENGEIVFI